MSPCVARSETSRAVAEFSQAKDWVAQSSAGRFRFRRRVQDQETEAVQRRRERRCVRRAWPNHARATHHLRGSSYLHELLVAMLPFLLLVRRMSGLAAHMP